MQGCIREETHRRPTFVRPCRLESAPVSYGASNDWTDTHNKIQDPRITNVCSDQPTAVAHTPDASVFSACKNTTSQPK